MQLDTSSHAIIFNIIKNIKFSKLDDFFCFSLGSPLIID